MFDTLARGGIFTYLVLAWAAVLYGAIFRQLFFRSRRYVPALRGALRGMILLGLAGSAVGLVQVGGVVGDLTVTQWRSVLTIAPIPLAAAAASAVPAAVLIGLLDMRTQGESGTDGVV